MRLHSSPLCGATLGTAGLLALLAAAEARAQFIPYFGKNKVKYDDFDWRVYRSPHFEVYYYPEFEQHLARVVSYAESAYQKVSTALKHELRSQVPLVLYKTHSEFEQTNIYPDFVPEGALAFTEPVRDRMVVPIDEPPDRLQRLITHELAHVFEFDLIPRGLVSGNRSQGGQGGVPLWVDEGLADYMRGLWDPLDLMTIRDAAIADQVPRLSRYEGYVGLYPRVVYNMGHACFEFIEARFGKEGIRQFLYNFRKGVLGSGNESVYEQAFRMKSEEFDDAFDKWLKERFKAYRDKQRPSDFGKDLTPDPEKGPYTQVIAFAPSPSGEMVAALTANRQDGELDVVLLSTKERGVIRNLTFGFDDGYEDISLDMSARQIGRSVGFDPNGESVAFFARTGKRRSLVLLSVTTGGILRKLPIEVDEASSPALHPDGKSVLFTALKDGVSDVYRVDLETGTTQNLTDDPFADFNPQVSPDGKLVVYGRRISGATKLYAFPLDDPARKTQLSFGAYDDVTPAFSPDGRLVFYASNEDGEIFNLRSLDLKTGAIRQYTDAVGGVMAPFPLKGKPERVAFITYFKDNYLLHATELGEALKEVEPEVRLASEEILDFQPDVQHQVVTEMKRKKKRFEGMRLERRPPLNVGITSGGDFFGGSQVALTDVLGDQDLTLSVLSQRGYRTYLGSFVDLSGRFQWGVTGFDVTNFYYSDYGQTGNYYSRDDALATQRYTGGSFLARYPFDRFRRLELSAGVVGVKEQYDESVVSGGAIYSGTLVPLSASFVQETTRFREFGPLAGGTFALGLEVAPGVAGAISRTTLTLDARKYLRLGSTTTLLALRARGFRSTGSIPAISYFGGSMELRGFDYLSISGNEGFFANAELRLPLVEAMKTPLGVLGPVRGALYLGAGGARYAGEPFKFASTAPGTSYVNATADDPSGEPVTGLHLVDGLASYGFGLQFFVLGYPLHFDWSRRTDLVVSSPTRFAFWVGFDF